MKRLSAADYETLLDMAADLQEAARIEEVAGEFFRAVARFDPAVTPLVELHGAWGQRRVLYPDGGKPRRTADLNGLAWRISAHGGRLDVMLWRTGRRPLDSTPHGYWAELRRQTTPAFLRACEYERILDESALLRDEFARAGAAMLLVDREGTLLSPSAQAGELLGRHGLTDRHLDAMLARIQARLELLPPPESGCQSIGQGETASGILRFHARSTAGGALRALYIVEADRFHPPDRFANLGLTGRGQEVLH